MFRHKKEMKNLVFPISSTLKNLSTISKNRTKAKCQAQLKKLSIFTYQSFHGLWAGSGYIAY